MSKEDGITFIIGSISGGVVVFLQDNWLALFVVPFIAGMVGIAGKRVGDYLINKVKKMVAKRKSNNSQEQKTEK